MPHERTPPHQQIRDGPAFLLLGRARQNAGDHLILERAKNLIQAGHPGVPIDVADASRPLQEQVSEARLARYRAIIIAGGPGYARGMSRIFPIGPIAALPPVVPLALGSYIVPGTASQVGAYRLGPDDRALLDAILERSPLLGARDPVTARMLRDNGYDRVLMTGDPAWYDPDRVAGGVIVPESMDTIALTPPANPAYYRQAIRLFERLAAERPSTEFWVIHHRGIQLPFARLADRRGWVNHEISGSASGFRVYDKAAMHVGYRVHAHLFATSRGILSYLVAEDSRGIGMIEGLGGLGIPGFRTDAGLLEVLAMRYLPRYAKPTRRFLWRLGPIAGRALPMPDAASILLSMISNDERHGFPSHRTAQERIHDTLPAMQRMVAVIP